MKNQKVAENEAVNVVTGREAKRIGIEIEFFNVNYRTAVAAINRTGVAVSYEGYTHNVMNSWKLVTDASVTSTGTGVGRGLELVSPPLTIDQMEDQLAKVLGALNECGAKVDRTCGVHVHHEIDDLNVDNIKNVYNIYYKHQNHINSLMPASRRQDAHARSGYCRAITQREMDNVNAATTIRDISNAQEGRYRVINFGSYVKYGTIEFRQHAGSTDFVKLFNWIKITQSLIAQAKAKKVIKPLSETDKKRETQAFNREVGISYTLQGLYSRDRKAEIRKGEEKRRKQMEQLLAAQ
jgi:Putative amidoligase enzyme